MTDVKEVEADVDHLEDVACFRCSQIVKYVISSHAMSVSIRRVGGIANPHTSQTGYESWISSFRKDSLGRPHLFKCAMRYIISADRDGEVGD